MRSEKTWSPVVSYGIHLFLHLSVETFSLSAYIQLRRRFLPHPFLSLSISSYSRVIVSIQISIIPVYICILSHNRERACGERNSSLIPHLLILSSFFSSSTLSPSNRVSVVLEFWASFFVGSSRSGSDFVSWGLFLRNSFGFLEDLRRIAVLRWSPSDLGRHLSNFQGKNLLLRRL